MRGVGRQMAVGAIWMIALKFIERGIGFVSTLILARLLVPADFGLVAMAMAVFAFVMVAGSFGFDLALIRLRDATRAHYDSAWTIQVGYGLFAGVGIALLAWPAAAYFNEPRLKAVMWVLAAVAACQALENIGTVDWRKTFRYDKDFQLLLGKKAIAFTVTMALAFHYRSYWALVAGMAASRVGGVVLSYAMHPYRPRLDLSEVRSLMGYSGWVSFTRVVDYFRGRGPDFMIGRMLGPSALGFYRVGLEVATLPTSELLYPIMRAVFPGYAAVANDRRGLARTFLFVQGTIVTLTLPAAVAIVLLAEPIVMVLLGPQWVEAIPLVRILGIYGALTVFQMTNGSIFHVLGVPHQAAWLKVGETALLLSLMGAVFAFGLGLVEAAWVIVAVQVCIVPVGMHLVARLLTIGFIDRLNVIWRPLIATAAMGSAMLPLTLLVPGQGGALNSLATLGATIPVGAGVFVAALYGLWRLVGRPDGPEQRLLTFLRNRWRPRT